MCIQIFKIDYLSDYEVSLNFKNMLISKRIHSFESIANSSPNANFKFLRQIIKKKKLTV